MSEPSSALTPVQLQAVEESLREAGEDVTDYLEATLLTTGRSNLTYRLAAGSNAWILRMPPRTGRTPSAHDVARELRVTAALGSSDVPVARAVALCENEELFDGPYTLSEFVRGESIQTRQQLDGCDGQAPVAISKALVEVLARLHRVDYQSIGTWFSGSAGPRQFPASS